MQTSDFDYFLPKELIAQFPADPRDSSKLMVIDKTQKTCVNAHFFDILNYFKKGDLVVRNNTKVFKARLFGKLMSRKGDDLWEHKRDIELFLVRPMENIHVWKVLANPGKHVLNGMKIKIAEDFCCEVILKEKDGTILVQFEYDDSLVRQKANKYGHVPVPPYVKQEPGDLSAYQTIYAKNEGSVAAPTAGFHFTDDLIEKMEKIGVEFSDLTLHVGLGTFLPVKSEKIEEHVMHSEWAQLTQEEAEKINLAKKQSRRIIAIGTTTTRALEGIAKYCLENNKNVLSGFDGEINIFIYPGFKFNIVDAMITNFHLPKSTLLMLVCAFAGDSDFMLKCYKKAVDEKYRFYSFGDGMIIN